MSEDAIMIVDGVKCRMRYVKGLEGQPETIFFWRALPHWKKVSDREINVARDLRSAFRKEISSQRERANNEPPRKPIDFGLMLKKQ